MITASMRGYENMAWRLYKHWRWSDGENDWPRGLQMQLLGCTIRHTVNILEVVTGGVLYRFQQVRRRGNRHILGNSSIALPILRISVLNSRSAKTMRMSMRIFHATVFLLSAFFSSFFAFLSFHFFFNPISTPGRLASSCIVVFPKNPVNIVSC